VVAVDQQGRVQAFVEKPEPGTAPSDLINAGAYVLEPAVLERIPEGRSSIERLVFPAMVTDGSLFAMPSPAYWIDVGTPATYLQAQLDLLDGLRGTPPAPGATDTGDGVWTLGSPVLGGDVVGPSLIGDAAYVAGGAHVERSIVGAGARIERGATVRDSVLLPGAHARAGAVLECSIVGERAVVSERTRLTALSVVGGGTIVERGLELEGAKLP
jgi:mannose-1-phosphate guanylyltransferase